MFLIAGLGNPENRYLATRHNTGFIALDRLAEKHGIEIKKAEKNALTGRGDIAGERVVLCKPQTYMNLSGESIAPLLSWYRIDVKDLLVIVDDIHLAPGQIRLRAGGSAGGHNGLKNIIKLLGTDRFPRLRIGVGEAAAGESYIPHVLGSFSRDEWGVMDKAIDESVLAAEEFIKNGIERAMNNFNGGKRGEAVP